MDNKLIFVLLCLSSFKFSGTEPQDAMVELPTLYEYYTGNGITAGLETLPNTFQLNRKDITIFSGAIHYFRVHPHYWRDRLRKLRAAGFNTVETYVAWNLHEPERDVYDFGDGGNDMSIFLDIVKFIQTAQEEDLFVLIRPGPYICAEWDFGGLPSWLLNYPGLRVRSSEAQFMDRVTRYYSYLLPLFKNLQFTKGGPIIGFQIENEYGGLVEDGTPPDKEYLLALKNEFQKHGLAELLYTSDNPSIHGENGALPGVLQTANFQNNPELELEKLKQFQPNMPSMVMEYWSGWFDHWFEYHHTTSVEAFADVFERIIQFPSSVNLYMFHGGTNFGFMNGANTQIMFPHYAADVTSYDYNAPLTEAGDYTEKYDVCIQLIAKYNKVITKRPLVPSESKKMEYDPVPIIEEMDFNLMLEKIDYDDRVMSNKVMHMEKLPINNGNGQSYGYILYRRKQTQLTESSVLQVKDGVVHDMGIVLVDGKRKTNKLTDKDQVKDFGYWEKVDAEFQLDAESSGLRTLDIFVENWGRVNFGVQSTFDQRKGLREGTKIMLDNVELESWEIIPLQFKSQWINSLDGWQRFSGNKTDGPKLLRTVLVVDDVCDTFLDMSDWGRGIVFVNGFHLGRYFSAGPVRSLFIPVPLLRKGKNEVIVFELFTVASQLTFRTSPLLGKVSNQEM